MSSFVKAKKEDVEKAISNFKHAYLGAEEAYDRCIELSKTEKVVVRSWIFFKKEVTKYSTLPNWWMTSSALNAYYPEILDDSKTNIIGTLGKNYFNDIIALYDNNPDEIYLDVKAAAKVVKWRDRFYG